MGACLSQIKLGGSSKKEPEVSAWLPRLHGDWPSIHVHTEMSGSMALSEAKLLCNTAQAVTLHRNWRPRGNTGRERWQVDSLEQGTIKWRHLTQETSHALLGWQRATPDCPGASQPQGEA